MTRQIYLIGLFSVALTLRVFAFDESAIGVVVETVSPNFAAERAGLRQGDILQRWVRGDAGGTIASPFDLPVIETGQVPLGSVTLEGLRGDEKRTWILPPGDWGLRVRPDLPSKILVPYQEGVQLTQQGKSVDAAKYWHTVASQMEDTATAGPRIWLLARAADTLATAHQWKESDDIYKEAIDLCGSDDLAIKRQLILKWAQAFVARGDAPSADHYYQVAEESLSQEEAPLLFANILSRRGSLALRMTDLAKAQSYYSRAEEIQQRLAPDSLVVAGTYDGLGGVARRRGDLAMAQEYYERGLAIRKNLAPDSMDVSASLNNLGNMAADFGNPAKAESYYLQSLAIRQKLAPGGLDVSNSFVNLGKAAWALGDLDQAEDYELQALAIREKQAPGDLEFAKILNNLGALNSTRGDLTRAEEYFQQSFEIKQKLVPDSLDVARALRNLGSVAQQRENFTKAEEYYRQALEIMEKKAPGNLDIIPLLDNLGTVAQRRHNVAAADKYYTQALEIAKKLNVHNLDLAGLLTNMGKAAQERGDLATAEQYCREALAIEERLSSESAYYAQSLAMLASIMEQKQNLDAAAQLFDQALKALDGQGLHLGGGEEARADFRAENAGIYKEYILLLLKQQRPELAFNVLERSRARLFLEMLAERDLAFGTDLTPELQSARQQNFAVYDDIQSQIAKLDPVKDSGEIERLLGKLRDLQDEREQIAERIRKASPHFAALQYPKPLDVGGVRQALDPGTVLLSYSVGEKETVLFVVRSGENSELSVFHLAIGKLELSHQVEAFRKSLQGWSRTDKAAFDREARALYQRLLAPAETAISPAKRVLVVPDGPLQILPFAALLRDKSHYLAEWKPVHTAVSATVYAELKNFTVENAADRLQLVAFGSPKYPPVDAAHAQNIRNPELRGSVERGFILAPLPFSKDEVNGIAEFFPGQSRVLLGDQATEEKAKAVGKNVRYIHFATHAVVDERFPLNSALVLAIPEKTGEGQENGLLQAWEIFEQVRINADLVTLSACETGLGKEVEGEGLIGLTRAFQYAGARSVLASLWSIPDASTANFMKRFYGHLKEGKTKDEALRQTQLEFLRLPQFARPFYWAAFSLNGDWR